MTNYRYQIKPEYSDTIISKRVDGNILELDTNKVLSSQELEGYSLYFSEFIDVIEVPSTIAYTGIEHPQNEAESNVESENTGTEE